MLSSIKTIIFLVLFVIGANIFAANAYPLLYSSLKGEESSSIGKTFSLPTLKKEVIIVNKYPEATTKDLDPAKPVKVDYLGKLNDKKIYVLVYSLLYDRSGYDFIKMIVIENEKDKYTPVYYRVSENGVETVNKSFILADKNLLVSSDNISGTGGYTNDFYYIFRPKIRCQNLSIYKKWHGI